MKTGIIGGTGVYSPDLVSDVKEVVIDTPFGKHSDMIEGKIGNIAVVMCFRHNRDHSLPPHMINFKANFHALKKLGVTRVISVCATGSLREDFKPADFVVPDQFIEWGENTTFFDGPEVYHLSMADPFCPELRNILFNAAKLAGVRCHNKGTYIRIPGPRFSTRAESKMYRQFADLIGMTGLPEAILAKEQGMCQAILASITDYDVWAEKPVSIGEIKRVMQENRENTNRILLSALKNISEPKCNCGKSLEGARA